MVGVKSRIWRDWDFGAAVTAAAAAAVAARPACSLSVHPAEACTAPGSEEELPFSIHHMVCCATDQRPCNNLF